jgi:type I restriction enzyme M protein
MSDFIAANLHKKVDHIMDVFFGAGVASHPTIIEQINYLLFMRALSQSDDDLRKIGVTDAEQLVFDGELEKYRWDNLLTLNAEQLFVALEECFRKIPESTTNKTVRLVFRNAHIKLFDKPTLRTVLHEIDAFAKLMDEGEHAGKRDIFGDTYEYLLSKLAQAGTSGQFRTPRHIIEFLVDVIAPKKGETIIDPAVGTAGFLVKAFEYLRRGYTSPEQLASGGAFDQLNSKEHTFLYEHTFSGFDSDEDMIKFGMMNLYLHGLQNARMVRQNTLTDTAGSRDKFDVILANPPFSGKIDRDSVAQELQMNTGATEVLFLRYMLRHLTDNGRAGVIVPEGVLFNSSGAYTKIREMLLENGLWCVVSLPGGVFNPYAGVKTSILFFDKTRGEKAEVLFAKVEHDGFSLSAQRRPIAKNDLPEILADIERYKNDEVLQQPNAHVVSYDRIKATGDINLNGDRYKIVAVTSGQKYQQSRLGDVFEVITSKWNPGEEFTSYIGLEDIEGKTGKLLSNQVNPPKSTKTRFMAGDILIGRLRPNLNKVWIANINNSICSTDFVVLRPKNKALPDFYAPLLRTPDINKIIVNGVSGANLPRVASGYLMDIKLPVPPIEVQKKVVDEIENKQRAIDHARAIISTLEKERSYFDPSPRAIKEGWPIVRIGNLIDNSLVGLVKSAREQGAGTTKYLKMDAITKNGLLKLDKAVVVDITADEKERYALTDDDLLFNTRNAPNLVGKNAVFHHNGREVYVFNNNILRIRFKKDVLAGYVSLYLNGQIGRKVIESLVSGTTSVAAVYQKDLLAIDIPLPPLENQKEIVAELSQEQEIVESTQKLICIYEKKIQSVLADLMGA